MKPVNAQRGFTLMEVLVALVVTGFTVATFFQLLGGSLRLERKSQVRTETAVAARQIFDNLLTMDIQSDDFPWEGEEGAYSWKMSMDALEIQQAADEDAIAQGMVLNLPLELYRINFEFSRNDKRMLTLAKVVDFERDELDPDFKSDNIALPAGISSFPEPGSMPKLQKPRPKTGKNDSNNSNNDSDTSQDNQNKNSDPDSEAEDEPDGELLPGQLDFSKTPTLTPPQHNIFK